MQHGRHRTHREPAGGRARNRAHPRPLRGLAALALSTPAEHRSHRAKRRRIYCGKVVPPSMLRSIRTDSQLGPATRSGGGRAGETPMRHQHTRHATSSAHGACPARRTPRSRAATHLLKREAPGERQALARNTAAPVRSVESQDLPIQSHRSPEPGARSPEPGARSPEPGARSPEPGARSPEPGARSPEPGARSPEPGARSPEPGARSPEPATRSPSQSSSTRREAPTRRSSCASRTRAPQRFARAPARTSATSTSGSIRAISSPSTPRTATRRR